MHNLNINTNPITTVSLLAHRHSVLTLAITLLLVVAAIFTAKTLTLDADLAALLPKSFESVQDLELVKQHFGGIGYIVLTASQAEPDVLRQFADDITPKLASLPDINFVDYRRPVEFFQDHALYFLTPDDLKIIKKRVKKRWRWEKRQHNPMYVDLEDSAPPSLEFEDLQEKYTQQGGSHWLSAQRSDEAYYFNEDKSLIAIFVKPQQTSADLDFSQRTIDLVQQQIKALDPQRKYPNIKIEITGRYQKQLDMQQQMQQDLGLASWVALGLVIGYLLLHFRQLTPLLLILAPLIVGIIGTFAFTALVFGQLNILTAFIGVILLGLGMDHGIHLISRYRDEQSRGLSEIACIQQTFSSTGRSVAIAAVTTLVIFVGLSLSEFKAFHEFGLIAGTGMLLIMAAYLVCLPPLLKLTSRFTKTPTISSQKNALSTLHRIHPKWASTLLWISLVIIFFTSLKISEVNFNYDFESLGNSQLRSFELDRQVNELLGYSQTPMVALTNNKTEEAFVTHALRQHLADLGAANTLDFLLSTADLLPTQQTEKQQIIQQINKIITKVKPDWISAADKADFEQLKRMVAATPFNYADLPIDVRQLFGDSLENRSKNQADHQAQGAIMLFPAISLSDGERVLDLADQVRHIEQSDGTRVPIAGESMILADILTLVFAESPKILILSLLLVCGFIWLFLKSGSLTAICLTPAILTIGLTLGLMASFEIELNYINMVMIPILLGIGVDSGIHIISRHAEGDSLKSIIDETGMAILGSNVTSGLGFAALLLTDHPGLNSLAYLALLGLSINLLVSLLIVPALIAIKSVFATLKQQGFSQRIHVYISTVVFAGYSPIGPGTVGSLAALPLCWLLADVTMSLKIALISLLTLGVWYSTYRYVEDQQKQGTDPQEIVSDEFIGLLITLAFVPWTLGWVISGFILFRLFDMVKFGPIGYIDRHFKNSFGILMDDVVAGLLAGSLLWSLSLYYV